MILRRITASLLMLCAIVPHMFAVKYTDSELRSMAARMLMVGFKGDSIYPGCDALRYINELKVGGIILFDVDLTGSATLGSRNITSKPQLTKLTAELRRAADYPLLIALDQEGGKVQRLKPAYGFQSYPSAGYIGKINNADTTRHYAAAMAAELAAAGINMNLAPDVDIHRDDCPVIGKLARAYSSSPQEVAAHAAIMVDEHRRSGVLCALKHFPGHGSATADSHYGLTDVTATWSREELIPFCELIQAGNADIIMTAHIFNRNLDADMPATLSHKIITELLRDSLGYQGVVMTDDMYMKGIIDHYSIEAALAAAINAGADMIVVGNNISTGFEPERPFVLVDMIVNAVKKGLIPAARLAESSARIKALSSKIIQ